MLSGKKIPTPGQKIAAALIACILLVLAFSGRAQANYENLRALHGDFASGIPYWSLLNSIHMGQCAPVGSPRQQMLGMAAYNEALKIEKTNPQKAIAFLQCSDHLLVDDSRSLRLTAHIYSDNNQGRQAAMILEEMRARGLANFNDLTWLGFLWLYLPGCSSTECLPKAQSAYQAALDLSPGNPDMLAALGRIAWYSRDFSKAQEIFQKLEKEVNCGECMALLSDYANDHKDYSNALKYCSLMIKNFPQGAWGYWRCGNAQRGLKNFPEAQVMYEKALELNPTEWRFSLALGDLAVDKKDTASAKTYYQRALELTTDKDSRAIIQNRLGKIKP